MQSYEELARWLNDNQGVLGAAIFIATLLLGWLSGIFSSLRHRPKFRLSLIEGPTFCCNYGTGAQHGDFPVHRTAFALYLRVANIGSAASSIEGVHLGYRCHFRPFTRLWLRYSLLGRLWLRDQTAAIDDFQVRLGENIKFFPFLTQSSIVSCKVADSFLVPGQSTNGVVYFEQSNSWGGFMPSTKDGRVQVKLVVNDTFGLRHAKAFWIRAVTMQEARTFNPSFGKTLAELRREILPHDADA